MSDAAAFKATYAGLRSLADGDYRISFDFPGEKFEEVAKILTHGGKPSAAAGTWFAIARLSSERGTAGDSAVCQITPGDSESYDCKSTKETSAPGPVTTSPVRRLSQDAFWKCNEPSFRVFLEQRRRHAIPAANHINNTDEAKHVLRAWLDVQSLSELDRDTSAADRWERVEADYKTWLTAARYVEEG